MLTESEPACLRYRFLRRGHLGSTASGRRMAQLRLMLGQLDRILVVISPLNVLSCKLK